MITGAVDVFEQFEHFVPSEWLCVSLCVYLFQKVVTRARTTGYGWKEWLPLSSAVSLQKGNTEFFFGACFSSLVSRSSTGDGCLFLLEPRASDSKPVKIKEMLSRATRQKNDAPIRVWR